MSENKSPESETEKKYQSPYLAAAGEKCFYRVTDPSTGIVTRVEEKDIDKIPATHHRSEKISVKKWDDEIRKNVVTF
jgi:hypothetical protein